jgi:hypothetical protein
MKAHKIGFKQPENEARLNLKPTQEAKGIKPKCNIREDDTCKNKTT